MLLDIVLAALLGVALLTAAGLKASDRTAVAVAAGTFGIHGAPARVIWLPLAALELLLAAGLLAGSVAAAWAAAALLTGLATAQAIAIAAGRGGAPCGCFGARGRVSWGSVARTALLAAAALALALGDSAVAAGPRAAIAAGALLAAAVVVARTRRRDPDGALEIADEGPPIGTRLELGGDLNGDLRVAFFSSADCRLCRGLLEPARALGAAIYDEHEDRRAWSDAGVPGAPFAIAFAADGTVLAKGTVNTRRQLETVLTTGRVRGGNDLPRAASSRRGFLAIASVAVGALITARPLVEPSEADAYHVCGHTFTTDSCPHPTGLPRIDRAGYPLRGNDGHRVDDLGRPVNREGAPVNKKGSPLLDPDGRPLPPTKRTRICAAVGKRFNIATQTDGTWSRCCDGHVRTIMDCCSSSGRRINGDGALTGYCYGGRKVFCIVYFQTKIPC